jgi:hypothetical protein
VYCSIFKNVNNNDEEIQMHTRIYLKDYSELSKWSALSIALLSGFMLYTAIREIKAGVYQIFDIVMLMVGMFGIVYLISYLLFVRLNLFRPYVDILSTGIRLKRYSLQKPRSFSWQELEKIDMDSYQPLFYLKNGSSFTIKMDSLQTAELRSRLKKIDNEKMTSTSNTFND